MVTFEQLPAWLRALYPFRPKQMVMPGGRVSYLDEGEGDEAVLMVHGNPTWSFFYRDLVQQLRGRFRCVVPDHLGCGLSDKPQDFNYTLPEHIANLARLVDALEVRRVHLVVHDWGGPIGLGTMLPRENLLGKVVVLNTAAFADSRIPWRIRLCRTPVLGEWLVRGLNGFAGPAAHMAVVRPLPAEVRRGFLFPYNSWANRIATHRFVVDIPRGVNAPNDLALARIESELPILRRHPTALLWGGRDFCFDHHYFARWREILPEARHRLFPEAGHYLLDDAREEVRDPIVDFLAS